MKNKAIKIIKSIMMWFCAFIIAFLIINTLCFVYNRNPGWIDRNASSTTGIWYPGKYIVHSTEGFGVYQADKNGYLNKTTKLEKDYIIAVGSSFTAGKEVMPGQRYTDILNDKLSKENNKLKVYNISEDSYYFPKIINGFDALIEEFPNSKTIIIEIGSTEFDNSTLETAMKYRKYDKNQNGNTIINRLNRKVKLKLHIKNIFPLLSNLSQQYKTYSKKNFEEENKKIDIEKYEKSINKILLHITEKYSGNIIVIYHPNITLEKDGKLVISNSNTDEIFKKSCENNNIKFINMSDSFIKNYEKNYIVPYGFSNTSLATGHLNYYGHQQIADELYEIIKGECK